MDRRFIKIWILISVLVFGNSLRALAPSEPALSDDLMGFVSISTEARDPADGAVVTGYCNASLVHPRALMTAAHCVRDAFAVHSNWAEVEIGKYKYVTRPDGQVVRIGYTTFIKERKTAAFYFIPSLAAKIKNQGLQTQIGPHEDLALILLETPLNLPANFPLIQVISQTELKGLTAIISKYNPIVISNNIFANMNNLDSKRFAPLNSVRWNSGGSFESTSSSRVEEGDSGAALIVQIGKVEKLIGVVKGKAQTGFSNWDVLSAVDQKICDIANQISEPEIKKKICN